VSLASPRRPRTALGLGFAAVVVAYLALFVANPVPSAVHGDGYYTWLWARTLADGDLSFADDYRECPDPWNLKDTPIGENLNYWNLGPALFWAPIFAVDRHLHPAGRDPNPHIATGCNGPLPERAVTGSMIAGLLTVLLGLLLCRRHFGTSATLIGVLGIAIGSGLAYYSTILLSYGHAASAFAGGLMVFAWDRGRRSPGSTGSWVAMGLALGLAMLMRSQNALLVLMPLGTWLVEAGRRAGRWVDGEGPGPALAHVARGVAFTAAMLLVFSPQLLFWRLSTGAWLTVSQGEHYIRWQHSMWHKALFSVNGLVPWAPLHLPAIVGLFLLLWRRRTRTLGVGLLAVFAADTYLVGAVYDWWGSVGYPGRRFDLLTVPFMVGLAAVATEVGRWVRPRPARGSAVVLAVLTVALVAFSFTVHLGVAVGRRTDTARPTPAQYEDVLYPGVDAVWEAVGNPLTWPASLPFALRYRTHPRRWDVVGGQEIFYHDHQTLERRPAESVLDLTRPGAELYADRPGPGRPPARTDGGTGVTFYPGTSRLFLPLHWPDVGALEVRATPTGPGSRLGLTVNQSPLGVREATGLRLRFEVRRLRATHQGVNELWVWVEGGPVRIDRVEVFDPDPPPARAQRVRNDGARAAQRRRLRGGGDSDAGVP
jgi:hypothetical protein